MINISNCPATAKTRRVIATSLIKEEDNNFRIIYTVDYFDGEARAQDAAPIATKHLFRVYQRIGTTRDSFINPQTQQIYDTQEAGTIPEIDFYRSIPCSTPLNETITNVGQMIDFVIANSVSIANLNNSL